MKNVKNLLQIVEPKNRLDVMKTVMTSVVLAATLVVCQGQSANVLYGTLLSVSQTGTRTNVTMELDIVTPVNRTWNGNPVSNDPLYCQTDLAGNFAFTNVIWGTYQLLAHDGRGTTFPTVYVGTNTLGLQPIAGLVKSIAAMPPNPATNYLTQAQVTALLSRLQRPTFDNTSMPTFDSQ